MEVRHDSEEVARVRAGLVLPIGGHGRRQLLGRHRREPETPSPARAALANVAWLVAATQSGGWGFWRAWARACARGSRSGGPCARGRFPDEEPADDPERLVPDLPGLVDRDAEGLGVEPGRARPVPRSRRPLERMSSQRPARRPEPGGCRGALPRRGPGGSASSGRRATPGTPRARSCGRSPRRMVLGGPVVVEADLLGEDRLASVSETNPVVDASSSGHEASALRIWAIRPNFTEAPAGSRASS